MIRAASLTVLCTFLFALAFAGMGLSKRTGGLLSKTILASPAFNCVGDEVTRLIILIPI